MLDGQAALVFGSSDGSVWNFQPRTGRSVWNFKMSRRGINTPPLVDGDTVYISQSEENLDNTSMGSATAFKGTGSGDITATSTLWQRKGVMDGRSMPVVLGDRIYFAEDGAKLFVFDKATGEPVGRGMHRHPVLQRQDPRSGHDRLEQMAFQVDAAVLVRPQPAE